MTNLERIFLNAYYKASETGQPEDWFNAGLVAKQMYNESRSHEDDAEETQIRDAARDSVQNSK